MKKDTEKPGILSRLGGIITHNWWLKLLSLVLAIVVYHSLKTDSNTDSTDHHDRHLFQYR